LKINVAAVFGLGDPELDSEPVLVRFVAEKITLGPFCFRAILFLCQHQYLLLIFVSVLLVP